MQTWTLKAELDSRGLTVEQAAMVCGMDYATMGVLYGGGKTLPRLALKVAKALKLTREQARQIGKALDRHVWCRANSGLPAPHPTDVRETWYEQIREPGVVMDAVSTKPVWLNLGAVALWLWQQGRDAEVGEWISERGCAEQKVNYIDNAAIRRAKIEEIESRYGIPIEVAECEQSMKHVVVKGKWYMDPVAIFRGRQQKGLAKYQVVRLYAERFGSGQPKTYKYVYNMMKNGEDGQGVSLGAAQRLCELLGMDLHNDVRLNIMLRRSKQGEKDEPEE